MNTEVKQIGILSIQDEASALLASEMCEVSGGTKSLSCSSGTFLPRGKFDGEEISSVTGCSSCNKTHSCQTVLRIIHPCLYCPMEK